MGIDVGGGEVEVEVEVVERCDGRSSKSCVVACRSMGQFPLQPGLIKVQYREGAARLTL